MQRSGEELQPPEVPTYTLTKQGINRTLEITKNDKFDAVERRETDRGNSSAGSSDVRSASRQITALGRKLPIPLFANCLFNLTIL